MTVFSPETRERVIALVRRLGGLYVDPCRSLACRSHRAAAAAAIALLDSLVHRDALILAYSDTFLLAGIAMAFCALAALVLRDS